MSSDAGGRSGGAWWRAPWRAPQFITAGVVLVVGLGLATWGVVAALQPSSFTMNGIFTLRDGATGHAPAGGECSGYQGYDDIAEGAQVTVYSPSNDVLAAGSLSNSYYTGGECSFNVVVSDVPGGYEIYQVEVSHRGKVSVAANDAEFVQLSLG